MATDKRPVGRPKGSKAVLPHEEKRKLADKARKHAEKALKTLVDVMQDTKAPAASRVAAAGHILDRGYGKAPQGVSLEDSEGNAIQPPTINLSFVAADEGAVTIDAEQ